MRRIRLVFLALAVLLLAPMGLLVWRALESARFEREVQHQTVAERIFDEMERPLAELARREEARPFGDYRFYLSSEGGASEAGSPRRSPLSEPPAEPYVVGYFQLDPDGSFHSPLVPRDRSRVESAGDWRPTSAILRRVASLEPIATRGLGSVRQAVSSESLAAPARQAPGTTKKSGRVSESAAPLAGVDELAQQKLEQSDTYRVFKRLNRAAKVAAPTPAVQYSQRREGARETTAAESRTALRALGVAMPRRKRAQTEGPVEFEREDAWPALADAIASDADVALEEAVSGQRIAELQRMASALVDDRYLVLSRTVSVDGRTYRQGLVLDVAQLADWIGKPVLAQSGLGGRAQLEFLGAAGEVNSLPWRDGFGYRHRFAVPFDALSVAMTLPTLSSASGAGYLGAVSALLMLAGTLGLLAVYRMVSVTVAFAERRSNFVAAVSHELKTPLTSIRMYGEMLRDGMVPSEEKRREYYSTITAESERLTRLINNVLEFSRLEGGSREMSLVAGPLGPLVEEAARLLEPHARELGFSIRVEVEPDLPPVRFDRDALLQVVFNLVDNALKYARSAGDRVIALQCRRVDAGVVLTVRDRGPGVAARHLSKIFEPFYRGEAELTRTAKGTGIGLALVEGLTKRMGAAVTGRNAPEGGFEVALTFRPA